MVELIINEQTLLVEQRPLVIMNSLFIYYNCFFIIYCDIALTNQKHKTMQTSKKDQEWLDNEHPEELKKEAKELEVIHQECPNCKLFVEFEFDRCPNCKYSFLINQ